MSWFGTPHFAMHDFGRALQIHARHEPQASGAVSLLSDIVTALSTAATAVSRDRTRRLSPSADESQVHLGVHAHRVPRAGEGAHAPALRHDRRQGRGGSSAYSKGVHDGRCSLLLCDTRTEMCCLDLEWRDTLCVHTASRVAEYRASCVFCTLYVRAAGVASSCAFVCDELN
mgnify:CR=1 FL=1